MKGNWCWRESISLEFFSALSNETDQEALLALQNLITSPNNFLANNWTKTTSFCSWFGVTCSLKRPRVVALALPNLQLQGTISPSLANLSFLREPNLKNNLFHGGIPYGLGHLPRLRVIDIQNNQLKGNIPTSVFQHRRVQKISLAFNEFSGEMWKGPRYVPELKILSLRNNSLKGIIPPSVGNATKLMNFGLTGNRISGNLPNKFGNMSQLAFLSLIDNQLTGSIPAALFNISSLVGMSVSLNSLSGPLLLDEGNIVSNLETYSSNSRSYFNISSLKYIGFNLNNLSGRIPTTTGFHLPNLISLVLGGNQLEGEIPLFITNASNLKILDLAGNFLTGTIPTNLGNLHELQRLLLHSNQLTNEPTEHELRLFNSLVDCRMLRYLQVGSNPLNGVLPNSIGNVSSTIEILYIGDTHLNGLIPQRFLGKFVGVEDHIEGQVYATMDKKMYEHTIVHCSKDIEEVEWDFLDFGEKNLVASGYVDLICMLRIEADSTGGLDLSNFDLALA
ncbi:putative LRR receptor-like serine/threonine-protein kinase-like [Capsicum annuum]|uniref:Leucine-rich repeat-containing N-terminal plant-type domain-containing protein n=1 Tax=Capsicum annuum TaxID=4072 RepID=A0A2G2ZFD5_CAPAN|nr:putative LRR receptor-like serine/threonine-protein kinase-like [Capsicum annuum]KAF3631388.1 putative LRR receptor-like serine/threonine-protein kinase-like [Capsicum annuum]PHT80709.1 hypothetical protein T459_13724 [Capsicum annuum]